jgi:uncharacterized protein (TIGR00369 family)
MSDMLTAEPQLSGLEQLKAIFEAPVRPGIVRTLNLRPVSAEKGRVVFAGTPGKEVYNPIGAVHGGYAATLLDSACGCAVHSALEAGQTYTTLELKVAYHRPMTVDTGEVFAEGKVVSLGRRAAFAEATIKDANGRLYASATSSLLVMSR